MLVSSCDDASACACAFSNKWYDSRCRAWDAQLAEAQAQTAAAAVSKDSATAAGAGKPAKPNPTPAQFALTNPRPISLWTIGENCKEHPFAVMVTLDRIFSFFDAAKKKKFVQPSLRELRMLIGMEATGHQCVLECVDCLINCVVTESLVARRTLPVLV